VFGSFGLTEILLLALILLLLFGAKRIPGIMGSFGEAVRHLRNTFKAESDPGTELRSQDERRIETESRAKHPDFVERRPRD
jgi:TatA/E family protein of Tat protein translocase